MLLIEEIAIGLETITAWEKGGVAICIKSNINIKHVLQSICTIEFISLQIETTFFNQKQHR